MTASILLLALGIAALLGVVNAVRPARNLLLLGPSWLAAWVTVELAPHLVALSTLEAVALVAFGALDHWTGWAGLAGLVVADAEQELQPRSLLRWALGSPEARSGGLRGGLAGVLTLMCSCCAAPVAVALRRARTGLPASVGFWLGNPALNPVVVVLFLAVLPWQWAALRLAAGVVVVAIGIALAGLEERTTAEAGTAAPEFAASGPVVVGYARSFAALAVRLLPEFLAVAFLLGAFRSELFPLGETSGGTVVLVLALVVAGLLLPVPTGGEVAVVAGLLAAGLPVAAAAALAVTLPVLSLPSLLISGTPSRAA